MPASPLTLELPPTAQIPPDAGGARHGISVKDFPERSEPR